MLSLLLKSFLQSFQIIHRGLVYFVIKFGVRSTEMVYLS